MRHLGKVILVLILAIAAGLIYWYGFRTPTDREILAGRLKALCENLDKPPQEGMPVGLIKSEAVSRIFTDPVEMYWPETILSGSMNAVEISANHQRFRAMVNRAAFGVSEVDINVVSKDFATVNFTGTVDAELKNGERLFEAREISSDWLKVDGSWRMSRLTAQDIIRR